MMGPPAPVWKGPKPKVPMRQLQWGKLPRAAVLKTFFKDSKADALDVDAKELEELFSKEDAAKPVTEDKPKAVKEVAHSVLEGKRQQNTSIFVKTLKTDVPRLREAILMLDEEVLNPEFTVKMLDNLPEPEEVAAIKAWLEEKPENRLEKMMPADQFFHAIGSIPQLRARLECFHFKQSFASKVSEIKPQLLLVKEATTSMKQNADNFNKLLELVLAVGNFLNSGTNNGNANGFNLRTLPKLESVKGVDKSTSLLSFLLRLTERKYKDTAAKWASDLAPVKYATKLDFEAVLTDLGELSRGLAASETKVAAIDPKPVDRWDVFAKAMPQQLANLKGDMKELEELAAKVQEEFKSLVTLYGEDPTKSKPEEFFGIIGQFMEQWEKELKETQLKELKDEKEKKKAELEAKKAAKLAELEAKRKAKEAREGADKAAEEKAAPAAPSAKKGEEAAPEEEEEDPSNQLDSAINSMKSGRAFERRRLRRQDTLRQKREQEEKLAAAAGKS